MKKYFIIILICFFSSCSNKSDGQQTIQAETETNNTCDSTYVESHAQSDDSNTGQSQTNSQPARQNAIEDAFNIGRSIGYQDALKGVNESETSAACYTDDWVKQSFIQGYVMGQAEAVSNGSAPDFEDEYEYEESEAYDDEY